MDENTDLLTVEEWQALYGDEWVDVCEDLGLPLPGEPLLDITDAEALPC